MHPISSGRGNSARKVMPASAYLRESQCFHNIQVYMYAPKLKSGSKHGSGRFSGVFYVYIYIFFGGGVTQSNT